MNEDRLDQRFAVTQALSKAYKIERARGADWYPRELPRNASEAFKRGWYAEDKAAFDVPDGEE